MNDPLRIAICEDTKADEEKLLSILNEIDLSLEYSTFSSGEALLAVFQPQMFDLLLTDIYMGGISGVDTVAKIREIDEELPVAFITTSTEFALEGYRLSVLKYIEKPFQKKEILEMLTLARMQKDSAPALSFQRNGQFEKIRFSEILYIEQQSHHINICLKNGQSELVHEKVTALLPQLEAQHFFQPHKSFAVNMDFVRSIDAELKCFIMQDGKNIPIRRESMSKAKQAMREHLFSRTRGTSL